MPETVPPSVDQSQQSNQRENVIEQIVPPKVDASTRASSSNTFSVDGLVGGLKPRDDIVGQDHMDPTKLAEISVVADRGDVLNQENKKKFESCMKKYCAIITGAEPTEATFMGFFISMVQASLNQSTSTKNSRLKHLTNTFKVGETVYTWKTAGFLDYLKGNFTDVANPLRQYLRGIEGQVEVVKATGKIKSDGHLAAKHGTTSQFWDATSDFTNGALTNISDDDLAANYLQRGVATKGKQQRKQIYNVSQIAGNV